MLLYLVPTAPAIRGEAGPPGTVTGRVTLTSRMRGTPISTNAYAGRTVDGQRPPASPEMRAVVVYLGDVPFGDELPTSTTQIKQEHESFSPRVAAITRGSTVDFPNFDPFFHNVFSLSGTGSFDLGRYQEGHSRSRTFVKHELRGGEMARQPNLIERVGLALARNYVKEMQTVRNRWAHAQVAQPPVDDAYRDLGDDCFIVIKGLKY